MGAGGPLRPQEYDRAAGDIPVTPVPGGLRPAGERALELLVLEGDVLGEPGVHQ
jgi:hypothetical protein